MKLKFFLIISLFVFCDLLFVISPINAISPSPTQSPTPTEASSNLDEIQKIRKAVQEKVQEKLKEIVNIEKKRGWMGTISSIDNSVIYISQNSQNRTINTDEETTLIDINKKKIDVTKLKEGQSILALGYEDSTGALTAKRVLVNDPDYLPIKKIITIGKIVDRSTASDVAVLIPSQNKNVQYQLNITTKTVITDLSGDKLKSKDVTTGKKAIVILTPNTKNKTYITDKIILVDKPSQTP